MANQHTENAAGKATKAKAAQPKDGTKASAAKTETKTETKIDDASDQTFPASDAPASWAGKDISPQDREDARKKQS